jgi:hypothetical protein
MEKLKWDPGGGWFLPEAVLCHRAGLLEHSDAVQPAGGIQRATGLTGYCQPASLRMQVFLVGRFWTDPGITRCSICPQPGAVLKSATFCSTNSYTMEFQLHASWNFNPTQPGDRSLS